jgi:hypothetical protein
MWATTRIFNEFQRSTVKSIHERVSTGYECPQRTTQHWNTGPQPLFQMNPPPLNTISQTKKDEEHLRLLSIFHFILAGLSTVGIGGLGLHYTIMRVVFSNPDMWKNQRNMPFPPEQFLRFFVWIYLFVGILLVVAATLNVMSGIFLRQKKNRLFSIVIAALNCLQFPFGTALGVFTIIVLMRDSVQQRYDNQAGAF